MPRHVRVRFVEEGVAAVARLLEDEAPETCEAIWANLPLEGEVYHSKRSGSDFYILPPAIEPDPGTENATRTPIAGDLTYAHVEAYAASVVPPALSEANPDGMGDLCVWYQRDNYHPGQGLNLFARVVENLGEFADACGRLHREGYADETLRFERAEDYVEEDPVELHQQRTYM
jgi:hypothetical protein